MRRGIVNNGVVSGRSGLLLPFEAGQRGAFGGLYLLGEDSLTGLRLKEKSVLKE